MKKISKINMISLVIILCGLIFTQNSQSDSTSKEANQLVSGTGGNIISRNDW